MWKNKETRTEKRFVDLNGVVAFVGVTSPGCHPKLGYFTFILHMEWGQGQYISM